MRNGYDSIVDVEVNPHIKDIYLTTTEVAGTFYRELDKASDSLDLDTIVYLKREARRPYDQCAIKVLSVDGYHIGYIPRRENKILKNLMDGGKILYGVINYLDLSTKVVRIHIYLSYKDIEDEISNTITMLMCEAEGGIC